MERERAIAGEPLDSNVLRQLVEARWPYTPEIGALLEQVIEGAIAQHPDLVVPAADFARHLVEKLPPGPPADVLIAARATDLYLAFACALRDEAAIAVFEASFASELRIVLAKAHGPKPDADDFRQACFERLFVGARPKILEYAGHGDLRSWLRVTLLRILIDLGRKRTESPAADPPGSDDDWVQRVPASGRDPELDYLKRHYQLEFQRAFEEAATELAADDRDVLRDHFGRGLTIDQIGALYNVHRATAARRIAKARDELFAGTRRRLMARLKLSRGDLDSVMRMIESDLHVSLHRILG